MILLELEIENYKQFQGCHLFTPTPTGVIGVIGANGAGKTTLFEAIEWCLYQPREIKGDEIPPRGDPGMRPRVRIRFQNPHTSATYEIERKLGKNAASAEIRQIDDSGMRVLANGSTAVSRYTATKLVGLEHSAFVATFFTRQKELAFFGNLKPTDRRREVGRLLGLETIRRAQELIAEERRVKQSVVQGLTAQYQQESGARDFDAERVAVREELAAIDAHIMSGSADLIAAEKAYKVASNHRAELVEQREATLKLKCELATLQEVIASAYARIKSAQDEISRLDDLAKQRPSLESMIADGPKRESVFAGLEADRDRAQKRATVTEQLEQAQVDSARLTRAARAELAPGSRVEIAEADLLQEIDTFMAHTASVQSAAMEAMLLGMRDLARGQAEAAELESKLTEYRKLLADVETKQAELLAQGEPAQAEVVATDRQNAARTAIATSKASIDAHNRALADYRTFIERPAETAADPICRMCGRPVAPGDREHTRRHAEQEISGIEKVVSQLDANIRTQEALVESIDLELAEIRMRASSLTTLHERVLNGKAKIEETEARRSSIVSSIDEQMRALARTEPVTDIEIKTVQKRLDAERETEKRRTTLAPLRASIAAALERVATLTANLAEIGEVSFDPAALQTARAALQESRDAATRLASIDQQLLRRPENERIIADQTERVATATAEAERLEAAIAANPIDELALERAEIDVEKARQQERLANRQLQENRATKQAKELALKQIDIDQQRLEEVAKRAESARVAADDLDRMYKEFNAFEQYVGRRVRPQLEDMTSELVRVITENKYESVQYDDDYGIKVWDGQTGAYPIEEFSGGERDVIALSARLALSRLIGSQAANPPSFLVLDEVFGSLDRDRRTNVLELLSSLAGSAESFQQLFVISHVDDVRLSPAFNEVWRVAETEDGASRLENLNQTLGTEDI